MRTYIIIHYITNSDLWMAIFRPSPVRSFYFAQANDIYSSGLIHSNKSLDVINSTLDSLGKHSNA